MQIGMNKGLSEKQLQKVFIDCMREFYASGGIQLIEEGNIDAFYD